MIGSVLDESLPYLVRRGSGIRRRARHARRPARQTRPLRDLFSIYQQLPGISTIEPPEEPDPAGGSAGLSFHVAGSIECDLGSSSACWPNAQLPGGSNALLLLLPLLTSAVETRRSTVHRRAHSNGKGGTHSGHSRHAHEPVLLAGAEPDRGPPWVRHRRAELATYAMDGLPTHESTPGVVVMPAHPDQVREIVRLLHLVALPFVARGAGTGLSGGAAGRS